MIPESFNIHRAASRGGVLRSIYHHSESLKEAVRRGAMPPLEVFNGFMACGVDDIARGIACIDIDFAVDNGGILSWQPFALTPEEYEDLLAYIRSRGGEFEVREVGDGTWQDWFGRLFSQKCK